MQSSAKRHKEEQESHWKMRQNEYCNKSSPVSEGSVGTTSLCSHGQLKLPQGYCREREQVWALIPALHASVAPGNTVVESIPPYVSHMLHICRESDLHLDLIVIIVGLLVELEEVGQALEALDHLLDPCRDVRLRAREERALRRSPIAQLCLTFMKNTTNERTHP